MPGKKGRSGPPGNLNGARHPWRSFWRRRALRREDRWVLPVLEGYALGLEADKPDLTEAERRVVEIAQTARGASMLILAEAARSGFIRPVNGTWDLAPGARELARFLSVERNALQSLGLERRPRPVPALTEYLDGRYGKDGGNDGSRVVTTVETAEAPAETAGTRNAKREGGDVAATDSDGPGQPELPTHSELQRRCDDSADSGVSAIEQVAPGENPCGGGSGHP